MLDKIRKGLGLERDMNSENIIKTDVYRYKRNKLASGLALLGLFINCLYFMLFYAIKYEPYANTLIGFSVILNLIILLATFLSSEGVKAYNKKYCIVLFVIAIIQIVRIFIYPLDLARGATSLFGTSDQTPSVRYFGVNLTTWALSTLLILYLVLSAACLIAAAIIGYVRAVQLGKFNKDLAEGKFTVEAAIAEVDATEAGDANIVADEKEVKNA